MKIWETLFLKRQQELNDKYSEAWCRELHGFFDHVCGCWWFATVGQIQNSKFRCSGRLWVQVLMLVFNDRVIHWAKQTNDIYLALRSHSHRIMKWRLILGASSRDSVLLKTYIYLHVPDCDSNPTISGEIFIIPIKNDGLIELKFLCKNFWILSGGTNDRMRNKFEGEEYLSKGSLFYFVPEDIVFVDHPLDVYSHFALGEIRQ